MIDAASPPGDAGIDWAELEQAAVAVRRSAHAPYSRYAVGAALKVASGRVFAGCNVENASFGLSICAERSAVVQMVAAGARDPVALFVLTQGKILGTPCGACRQTLAEFAADLPIYLAVDGNVVPSRITSLAMLLPDAFRAAALDP